MKKNYYIITGTSKGIGQALAYALLDPENVLFCISRTQNPRLTYKARAVDCDVTDIELDLNDWGKIRETMHHIIREISQDEVASLNLINNAGTIHPIKHIGTTARNEEIAKNIHVNLLAPMLITEGFIGETRDWQVEKRVVHLSSGAAKYPVDAWSAYCSAKAGLDMFARCLALEEKDKQFPVKVVGFAPGVVNTEMQEEIRETNPDDFAEVSRFKGYHSNGDLISPETVAKKILETLGNEDFGKETLVSIRDMM